MDPENLVPPATCSCGRSFKPGSTEERCSDCQARRDEQMLRTLRFYRRMLPRRSAHEDLLRQIPGTQPEAIIPIVTRWSQSSPDVDDIERLADMEVYPYRCVGRGFHEVDLEALAKENLEEYNNLGDASVWGYAD